jgi:hypothetical protein
MKIHVNGVEREMTPEQEAAFEASRSGYALRARMLPKSVILSRLTDAQLDAIMAAMTVRQKERWRSPDRPRIATDDAELLAMLAGVGADPAVVLA